MLTNSPLKSMIFKGILLTIVFCNFFLLAEDQNISQNAIRNTSPIQNMRVVCKDGICYLEPIDSTAQSNYPIKIVRSTSGYQTVKSFSQWLKGDAPSDNALTRIFSSFGWLPAILLTIILGICLNLTPCVLPMIPINLSIIGIKTRNNLRRGILLGGIYGLCQAITFGIIGLIFVLFGGMFGAITQTAWFNGIIAVIFLLLSLAMLDVFSIDFSRFRPATVAGYGISGLLLPAFLGAIGAILASACVAPVLIWVLLLATSLFAQHHYAALILPFALGLGLGLPWPFLGAGITRIPHPGRWMNLVKFGFAILIFAMAIYYGYTSYRIAYPAQPPATTATAWLTSLDDGIATAKILHKDIFIDFWGNACKNCQAMDVTTLRHPSIIQELEKYVLVKINADLPENSQLLKQCNVIGLPTYIIATCRP